MIATLTFIVAVVTAVWVRTRGFLFLWVVLLNAWLAMYVRLMLSPTLAGHFPPLADRRLLVAAVACVTAGVFLVVSLLATRLFSAALDYRLPAPWDQSGAGACGFLTGYLVINYVLFVASLP